MKELLSKKFWRDVKKTFDEARAPETTPRSGTAQPAAPAETNAKNHEAAEIPPPEATLPEE
jgi:hypothetical protein